MHKWRDAVVACFLMFSSSFFIRLTSFCWNEKGEEGKQEKKREEGVEVPLDRY